MRKPTRILVSCIAAGLLLAGCGHKPPTPCDNTSQFEAKHGDVVFTSPDKQLVECFDGAVFVKISGRWTERTTGYFGN